MSARFFFGPSVSFTADSVELSAGQWLVQSSWRTELARDTVIVNDTLQIIESTGLADSFEVQIDTSGTYGAFTFAGAGTFVGGNGMILLAGLLPQETNIIRVVVFDTNNILPAISDSGRIFVDLVAPVSTTPDTIINNGGVLTDTRRVTLNFGSTGGNVSDTAPGGVRYFYLSETSATQGTQFAYTETYSFSIPDTMLNPITSIATIYFRFEDYAGNVSSVVSDTILVDLNNPNILIGNGGLLGSYLRRAKGQPITMTARMNDSGGVSIATLFVRHMPDTSTYQAIAMSNTGSAKDGVWTVQIPVSVVGYIADSTYGVAFTITCTDVVGRSRSYGAPDTIEIVNGVDGRVYTKLPQGTDNYTEITQSGAALTKNGSFNLKIQSAIGDTVEVYRFTGGVSTLQGSTPFYQVDFAETLVSAAGPFSTGDSLIVIITDSEVALAYIDTFYVTTDNIKPVISTFALDPVRTAVDTYGVYLRLTMNQAEQNLRLFITQNPDTSLASDTTRQYTGTVIDSTAGLPIFTVNPAQMTGDTAVIYASAWDAAGNIAILSSSSSS